MSSITGLWHNHLGDSSIVTATSSRLSLSLASSTPPRPQFSLTDIPQSSWHYLYYSFDFLASYNGFLGPPYKEAETLLHVV